VNRPDPAALRRLTFALALIAAFTLALRAIAPGPPLAPDFDGNARGAEVVIEIAQGASGSEIAELLYEAGIVKSVRAFFQVAVSDTRSERIAPGEHRIERGLPAAVALEQLLDADRIVNLIRIRDGARLDEVRTELRAAGFSNSEVNRALASAKAPAGFEAKSLEGFLYPAFYTPTSGATAADLVSQMIRRFEQSTGDLNWSSKKYSPIELLTIASIVESEGTPDVHAKVARVIYNRLANGMALQMDSTIHYILGTRGNIRVSIDQTKVASRYNTYRYPGLPPGPIGSPTRSSIEATLEPATGPWLYFVSVSPTETKFTDSYEEFLSFKAEFRRNYRAGLFK